MKPSRLDLLQLDEKPLPESYKAMLTEGFIDNETIEKARVEVERWYKNPYAFHFWSLVFAAGQA